MIHNAPSVGGGFDPEKQAANRASLNNRANPGSHLCVVEGTVQVQGRTIVSSVNWVLKGRLVGCHSLERAGPFIRGHSQCTSILYVSVAFQLDS